MFEYFVYSFSDFLTLFNDVLYIVAGSTAVLLTALVHEILRGGRT